MIPLQSLLSLDTSWAETTGIRCVSRGNHLPGGLSIPAPPPDRFVPAFRYRHGLDGSNHSTVSPRSSEKGHRAAAGRIPSPPCKDLAGGNPRDQKVIQERGVPPVKPPSPRPEASPAPRTSRRSLLVGDYATVRRPGVRGSMSIRRNHSSTVSMNDATASSRVVAPRECPTASCGDHEVGGEPDPGRRSRSCRAAPANTAPPCLCLRRPAEVASPDWIH